MPIIVNLDVMLAKRKVRSKELAGAIGITEQNRHATKRIRKKVLTFLILFMLILLLIIYSNTAVVAACPRDPAPFNW